MQFGLILFKVHLFCVPFSCSSSIGNQQVGKQRLSIGKNCDRVGTVEHEFLHALGLRHEQSRADRSDYVNIMWDRIVPGDLASKNSRLLRHFISFRVTGRVHSG